MSKYKVLARIAFARRFCTWAAALCPVMFLGYNVGVIAPWARGELTTQQALNLLQFPWFGVALACAFAWVAARAGGDPLPPMLGPERAGEDDGGPWQHSDEKRVTLNNATGLQLGPGGFDALGNTQGFDMGRRTMDD